VGAGPEARVFHLHVRDQQGLRVDLIVDRKLCKQTKAGGAHVRRRKDGLARVRAGAGEVVVIGGDVDLALRVDTERAECKRKQEDSSRGWQTADPSTAFGAEARQTPLRMTHRIRDDASNDAANLD